jgi:hypothetical protein
MKITKGGQSALKHSQFTLAIALAAMLVIANLAGATVLVPDSDGCAIGAASDNGATVAKAPRPKPPKPPKPDNGPTLPPDPWEPV